MYLWWTPEVNPVWRCTFGGVNVPCIYILLVQLPSMKAVQPIYGLNLQLDNGGGSSHPCPALDLWGWWHVWSDDHLLGHQEVIVRPHMPSASQIQWACYKKWKVGREAQAGMYQWLISTFENSCGCTALDMLEWWEITKQIGWLAGKATLTSGLLLRRSEVLRSFRHYLQAQSQGDHIIDRLEERGMERGSEKGWERAIVSQTKHWNCFKGNGETSRRLGEAHMGFPEHIDTILNWTKLNCINSHARWDWVTVDDWGFVVTFMWHLLRMI